MQTVLEGRSITAATAGQLLPPGRTGDDTITGHPTGCESIGWLAIARRARLEIWLEFDRDTRDANRSLVVANETKLDHCVLALASCPQSDGGEDVLLVVTEIHAWELVRLNPKLPLSTGDSQGSTPERDGGCVELSVRASGSLGSGLPRSFHDAGVDSSQVILRLAVWKSSHDVEGLCTRKWGSLRTVGAFASEGAITLLTISDDTKGGPYRDQLDGGGTAKSKSETFPLTSPAICGLGFDHVTPTQANGHSNAQQEDFTPPAVFGVSAVLDMAILPQAKYGRKMSAGDVDPPLTIALLLVKKASGGGRGGACGKRGIDTPEVVVRTCRWDLGGDHLNPGHWYLLHLHPDTRIAPFSEGGLVCVDPNGVRAFDWNGNPLLGVGGSPRRHDIKIPLPKPLRGSWGASANPVVLTPLNKNLRRRGKKEQGFVRDKGVSNSIEDFLIADIHGTLHRISMCIIRRSGQLCESAGSDHARIECTKLHIRAGLVPSRLRHNFQYLLPVGSRGVVFAAAYSCCFPLVVRIARTPCDSLPLSSGTRGGCRGSDVEGGPRAEKMTAPPSWHMLEEGTERQTRLSLGAISGMVVLPHVSGDEQDGKRFRNFVNNHCQKTKQSAYMLPGHANMTSSEGSVMTGLPRPREITVPQGQRVVLATASGCLEVPSPDDGGHTVDPADALCILEHGFGLDTKAEGSIGLQEGVKLFAQPITLGGAGCSHKKRQNQSWNGNNNCTSRRFGGNHKAVGDGATQRGHVLLLSDRVRSSTNFLIVSQEGEVAPCAPGKTEGFESGQHTIHLGRTEPSEYIVQVTEDSINIVRQPSRLGVFERAASWQPQLLSSSPSSSALKVTHACSAGTAVAVVCDSTLFLTKVQEATPLSPTLQGLRTVAGEDSPKEHAALDVKELWQGELDGGSVSALDVRLLGTSGCVGEHVAEEPVFIAASFWDSCAIGVYSFSSPSARNETRTEVDSEYGQRPSKSLRNTAVVDKVATWHPPWGESSFVSGAVSSFASQPEEGSEKESTSEGVYGAGNANCLTRALAFVRFGDGLDHVSLVAATADGAVAVAEWRKGRSWEDEDNPGEEHREREMTGKNTSVRTRLSFGTFVTVASFQIGEGPVRLEVFASAEHIRAEDRGGDGGGKEIGGNCSGRDRDSSDHGERVFVNGEMMDAVVCRFFDIEGSTPTSFRGVWQCTRVCRTGYRCRRNVVHLPQSEAGTAKNNGEFAWLTTQGLPTECTTPRPCSDAECGGAGGVETVIRMNRRSSARLNNSTSSCELTLSFGTLDDSKRRGRCRKKSLSWKPTHLVYVPVTRSIVVAGYSTSNGEVHSSDTCDSSVGTILAFRGGTVQGVSPLPQTRSSYSSSLRIFDAETMEERSGSSPVSVLPWMRITGIAVLASPSGNGVLHNLPLGANATAAQVASRRIGGAGRSLRQDPDTAAAVGGDVIAVACCGNTTTVEPGGEGLCSGVKMQSEGKSPGLVSSGIGDDGISAGNPEYCGTSTADDADNKRAPPLASSASFVTTVVAAFEVVACCADGTLMDAEGGEVAATNKTSHRIVNGVGNERVRRQRTDCEDGDGHGGGGGTILAALAASSEMAGACFNLETLGKEFVVASIDDKVVVFGWKGRQPGDLRSSQPAPSLRLDAQASCRTTVGGCVTALGCCGNFIAVAEFLHGVSLYRFDERSLVLSVVATHPRQSLVVTALALSRHPVYNGTDGSEHDTEDVAYIPLVALADRSTRTVAVLAGPRSCRGSTKALVTEASIDTRREGSDNGEEKTGGTKIHGDSHAFGGSHSGVVDRLHLAAVWPCDDEVTSLVAASGAPSYSDSVDNGNEDNSHGQGQQRQEHRQPQYCQHHERPHRTSVPSKYSRRVKGDSFLLGTASGAVLKVRVNVPLNT